MHMFNNPFSFDGRIRRTEYGLSMILYFVAYAILFAVVASDRDFSILFIAMIPMLWFLWAQGAKRCHDLGNSGWWQLIPFYPLWLIFQDGQIGVNQYGENPKGNHYNNNNTSNNNPNNQGGYSGGYSGGHNNPNSGSGSYSPTKNDGYNNGDLYK
jgi:uncharacterized membrane protein YhaH (DUF805 family)